MRRYSTEYSFEMGKVMLNWDSLWLFFLRFSTLLLNNYVKVPEEYARKKIHTPKDELDCEISFDTSMI